MKINANGVELDLQIGERYACHQEVLEVTATGSKHIADYWCGATAKQDAEIYNSFVARR